MPAGTGLRAPETPTQKRSARREHPVSEKLPKQKPPPIRGLFACLQERSAIGRMRGGGRSPLRTRLHAEFPANREINREFRKIRLLNPILNADTRANSEACNKIPYSTERGIFAKEQGICAREQGIWTRRFPDDVFGRDSPV